MAEYVATVPAGDLTQGAYVDHSPTGGGAVMPSTFGGVDPDEAMLPAEEGAMGAVGPVMGAQHMPNAAQPGSM